MTVVKAMKSPGKKQKSPKGEGPATPNLKSPKGKGPVTPRGTPKLAKTPKGTPTVAKTPIGTPIVAKTPKGTPSVAKTSKGTSSVPKAAKKMIRVAKTSKASIKRRARKRKASSDKNGQLGTQEIPAKLEDDAIIYITNTSGEESVKSKIMPLLTPHWDVVKIWLERGILNVAFKTAEEALAAIKNLNGLLFDGRNLVAYRKGSSHLFLPHSVKLSNVPCGVSLQDILSSFGSCGKIVYCGPINPKKGAKLGRYLYRMSFETADGAEAALTSDFKEFRGVEISRVAMPFKMQPCENCVVIQFFSSDVTEDDIRQFMGSAGFISGVWFKTSWKKSPLGSRYAIVAMTDAADVEKALQLNNTSLKNSVVKVVRREKLSRWKSVEEEVPAKKQKLNNGVAKAQEIQVAVNEEGDHASDSDTSEVDELAGFQDQQQKLNAVEGSEDDDNDEDDDDDDDDDERDDVDDEESDVDINEEDGDEDEDDEDD